MADRRHALASRRWGARRDPERDRRPLRLFLASEAFSTAKAQASWTPSTKPSSYTAYPHRCSPTTAPCSLPHPARARCSCKQSSSGWDHQQELAAIPPPNLRKDRALAPDPQALPHSPARPRRPSQSYKPSSIRSSTTTDESQVRVWTVAVSFARVVMWVRVTDGSEEQTLGLIESAARLCPLRVFEMRAPVSSPHPPFSWLAAGRL